MSVSAKHGKRAQERYESCFGHLFDELKRIDMLIYRQVLKVRQTKEEEKIKQNQSKFFISDDDVDVSLSGFWNSGDSAAAGSGGVRLAEIDEKLGELVEYISRKEAASAAEGFFLPLRRLTTVFKFTPFEKDLLLLSLAVELDSKYERLYAYLHNDICKKNLTADLALSILCDSAEEKAQMRPFFSNASPLFEYGMLHLSAERGEGGGILLKTIEVDSVVLDFLLGHGRCYEKAVPSMEIVVPKHRFDDIIISREIKDKLARCCEKGGNVVKDEWRGARKIFQFKGPKENGQRESAEAVCRSLGLGLIVVDVNMLVKNDFKIEGWVKLLIREALLRLSAIYFKGFDKVQLSENKRFESEVFLHGLANFAGVIFFESDEEIKDSLVASFADIFVVEFPFPAHAIRKKLWENSLRFAGVKHQANTDVLADMFILTGGQIRDAILSARNIALMKGNESDCITMNDFYEGCRSVSNRKLGLLSKRICPGYGWSDIVLPKDRLAQLTGICSYLKYRQQVFGQWGFNGKLSYGKGLSALFCGSSGTGKTMAAEVIAKELALDLYKIDLSTVVSKYIGETEKNLSNIFKEAETSNAILFFDEADALFGKRSEVRDAHDRYANIEVGYLLQRIEEYEGVVILATNLKKNMDEAFMRRMQFVVEFPAPDEANRLMIWKGVFPEAAPLSSDIDFEFLAGKFKLTGGNIKNIALSAAFLAAEASEEICMEHIILATQSEYRKIGKLCLESDFGKYYAIIQRSGAAA